MAAVTDMTRDYDEHGFAAVHGIVSPPELAILRELTHAMLRERLARASRLSRSFGLLWAKLSPEDQAAVRGLAVYEAALAHARALLGTTELISGMSVFHKLAKPNSAVPWHQDESYRDPNQVHHGTTLWLPLRAVDVDAGCLQYVPGSQRRGVVPHMRDPRDPTAFSLIAVEPPEEAAVAVPLRAGSGVFHDLRTLHCSGVNRTPEPRPAITLHFSRPPVPREGDRREWLSDVVRANPTSNLGF